MRLMMHPRNIYDHILPDFKELALTYPKLADCIQADGSIDLKDPHAVCALTEALLKQDFQLDVELPSDRLCPRVSNRLNYILWIQDLLDSDNFDIDGGVNTHVVTGLDVGTGVSCIYPLLGCRLRSNWNFIGTDIDERAVTLAKEQITRNDLSGRIQIMKSAPGGPLFDVGHKLDFTMCNPPFYSSMEDIEFSQELKVTESHSFTNIEPNEMITFGGEVAFVKRMISESVAMSSNTTKTWFTSMLGKLSSLKAIVEELVRCEISNYVVTEFLQGQHTRRWAVAWRFDFCRAVPELARPISPAPSVAVRALWPAATCATIPFVIDYVNETTLRVICDKLNDEFGELIDVSLRSHDGSQYILGFSKLGNIWSRAFRRQKRRKLESDNAGQLDSGFGFRIFLNDAQHNVTVHWSYGLDSKVFQSFCGMLKTKLSNLDL
ncbi:hypothetical protein V1512DRAFT_259631 [Lipomyces arxii]|uniref:uncharacterized protein n=1 Tax=Lipomyces arxii TaxID=56418 RepID=UPI0034CFB610